MDELENRLQHLAELTRERELLTGRAAELRQRHDALAAELTELRDRHAVEQRDVDRLEGMSLTRILVALRGSREDALDRERAEADAARYRVAEAQDRLAVLERGRAVVAARLAQLADVPARQAAAIDDKERYLRATGGPQVAPLLALADERGRLEAELRELREAAAAADTARQALVAVQGHLDSADNWSTYDTFLGGGVLSSAVKHDRLDGAAQAAAHADRCLAVLRAELADVGVVRPTGTVAVEGLTRFVDVWFDNIFTDLAVRDHIKQAQRNIAHSARMVADVREGLARRTAAARTRLDDLARARRDLLVR